MRKLFKQIKRINLLIIFCFFLILIFSYRYFSKSSCTNPFEVQDYTESKKEVVKICGDKFFRGNIEVVNKSKFPDLFEYKLNKDKDPVNTEHRIRIFSKEKGSEYVSIISVIDWTTWLNSSIGIYRKEGNTYKQVFKRTFSDNNGRWIYIHFLSSEPMFYNNILSISDDLGYLGCYSCRINWTDYYDWSDSEKTFVLANNKHSFEFKKLLEEYETNDVTICKNEANLDESITNLYQYRNGNEKFCGDSAEVPFTSSGQATIFLKAKKAIGEIINGKNFSIKDVENIKL